MTLVIRSAAGALYAQGMGTSRARARVAGHVEHGHEVPTRPTRSSCLECVEKHLGAAWVLMAEHRDGYPHRIRAIGHLHEAEDESQAWPLLHVAIREARKGYQQEGLVPDFAGELTRIILWFRQHGP